MSTDDKLLMLSGMNDMVVRVALHSVGRETFESARKMPLIDLVGLNVILDKADAAREEMEADLKRRRRK